MGMYIYHCIQRGRYLLEQLAELELRSEGEQVQLAEVGERLQQDRDTLSALQQEQDIRRGELQRGSGRLASLEALQQAALAQGSDVGDWLSAQGLQGRGLLAEQLQVEAGWEAAVEAVLADDLQAIALDDLSSLDATLAEFEQGSLRLLQRGAPGQTSPGSLLDKVDSPLDLRPWLAAIRPVESVAEALAQRAELAPHESLITREGHWVGPNWLRFRRGEASEGGVLARQQEMEQLQASLDEQQAALDSGQERIDQLREGIRALELQRDGLQQTLAASGRQQGELKALKEQLAQLTPPDFIRKLALTF